MFENQKRWLKEKGSKGFNWFNEHRFAIGCGVGVSGLIALEVIINKILDPKTVSVVTKPGKQEGQFLIRTVGTDRFGADTTYGPWVLFNKLDLDRLVGNAEAAMKGEKGTDYLD